MKSQQPSVHHDDTSWMRRALVLARRRAGRTWPNPTVGACVVRDGRLLGEAVHERAGAPHAEAAALDAVVARGHDPAGSTVYVTLEPCHHHGRTPPCSRRLVEAGVARVVYAVDDATDRRPSAGAAWLRAQGVEVRGGVLRDPAWELNHPFFETRRDDEIHWTLKLALSADGGLAPRVGRIENPEERAVTGPRAHRRVHRMRASAAAVLVGAGTVAADHPRLDVRLLGPEQFDGPQPRPVVLDPRLRLDPGVLPRRSLVFCAPSDGDRQVRAAAGHETRVVPSRGPGRLDWKAIERELASLGLGIVLVEGGAAVATDLLEAGLPHRVHLFLAPRLFGPGAPRLGVEADLLERYESWRVRRVGADVEWILRRRDLPVPPAVRVQES